MNPTMLLNGGGIRFVTLKGSDGKDFDLVAGSFTHLKSIAGGTRIFLVSGVLVDVKESREEIKARIMGAEEV